MKLKQKMYMKILVKTEMLCFISYSAESKYYDCSYKLDVGKMKDVTAGVAIKKFVRLKTKGVNKKLLQQ